MLAALALQLLLLFLSRQGLVCATDAADEYASIYTTYVEFQKEPESFRSGFCTICLRLCDEGAGPAVELHVPSSDVNDSTMDTLARLGEYLTMLHQVRTGIYRGKPIPADNCKSVCDMLVKEFLRNSVGDAKDRMDAIIEDDSRSNGSKLNGKIMSAAMQLVVDSVESADDRRFTCDENVEGRVEVDMNAGDAALLEILDTCWVKDDQSDS